MEGDAHGYRRGQIGVEASRLQENGHSTKRMLLLRSIYGSSQLFHHIVEFGSVERVDMLVLHNQSKVLCQ